jgi:hypothetical protein
MNDPLAAALERTMAAGTARLTLATHYDFRRSSPLGRRRGGLLGAAVQRVLGAAEGAEVRGGEIDFAAGRATLAGARRSVLVVGDREWTGRPGTPVADATEAAATPQQPLWVFDLCRGIVDAEHAGGGAWSHHRAHTDLMRVGGAVPYEVAMPFLVERVGTVARLPVDVWTDADGRIRRVRVATSPLGVEQTLELRDFGVEIPADHWTRLPVA